MATQVSATLSTSNNTVVYHPIIGTWTYTENGCDETYTFNSSGIRVSTSNEEIVKAKYEVKTYSKEKNIYLLKDEVLEDNGKADCSGSTSNMVGDVVVVLLYIQDNPKRFNFCFDKELKDCFGPFIKKE